MNECVKSVCNQECCMINTLENINNSGTNIILSVSINNLVFSNKEAIQFENLYMLN
jgi:hypothetical protein